MNQDEVLALFKQCGALLEGHFRLTSGLHSGPIFSAHSCCRIPGQAKHPGWRLAARIELWRSPPDLVVAPALGGILVAHEVARALGVRGLFAERQDRKLKASARIQT